MMEHSATSPPWKVWLAAGRPRTLALAVASVGLGLFLAAARSQFRWTTGLLTLLTAFLLQILSNLANDYGDSLHGADSQQRAGPRRAVQSGLIRPQAMRRAVILVAILSIVCGLGLVWTSLGAGALWLVVLFLVVGAAAVWAAIAYTAGGHPYGYRGLGDLFVFLFFGWVGVAGSYFLQTRSLPAAIFLPATACGLFCVAVLNVNNVRDIDSDRRAGKLSIAVRLGPRRARLYHWGLLLGGLGLALLYVLLTYRSPWQFLFLLSAPLLLQNGLSVWRGRGSQELDPLLKQMSVATLLFAITFGLGHLLA